MFSWPLGWSILAGALPFILELLALYLLLPMLQQGGAKRPNYLGQQIPVAAGISFPLVLLISYLPYRYFHIDTSGILIGVILMALLGLIDDLLGNRDAMGFKGHIYSLLQGQLTTGGLKMLMGGMTALYAATYCSQVWYWWLINALIIALATNLINLLDLRPGRAIKGFLIFLVPVLVLNGPINWWLLLPLLGIILAYFPFDLQARAMMGDTGSNVLGFVLGYYIANVPATGVKLGLLAILVALTLLSEKVSFSKIIEKVTLLSYIDQLGRKMKTDEQQRTTG